MRRLSEDLERPPPPPPPPPPSPPTPEEPELEEDDDVAESVVSDWALEEDLDSDHGPTLTTDDLRDPVEPAAQPESPVEGLGLHTGEPHLNDVTTPQPQPGTMKTDDLINLEEDPQPTAPQEEAPEPHATRADTGAAGDPQVEEATSSQGPADAHVPDAAGHHADLPAPSNEPSASRNAGASMPADPFAGSDPFISPNEDDDLENPWAEDTPGADLSPPSPPSAAADPARASTPTSDYHDANSTHGDEGGRQEAPPAEQEQKPGPSPVHLQERDSPAMSGDEDQPTTEAPILAETPIQGETEGHTNSGDDATTQVEEEPEENPAPSSPEGPTETPLPAGGPIQTTDPVQSTDPTETANPDQGAPPVTDPAEPSPPVTDSVTAPTQETTQTQEEHGSSAPGTERDEMTRVDSGDSKDIQAEEPPVQSTTSGTTAPEQSEETAEAEGLESSQPGGGEGADKAGEEVVNKVGKGEEATVPATTTTATTEPAETTAAPVVTADAVDNSPASGESSGGEASGAQANEPASASETPAAQPQAEAISSSLAQDEDALEQTSIPSVPSATESSPSSLPVTDTTPATTALGSPSSPTVRLASGIEAQLVDCDPESTEQTPSASPSDTPPVALLSPSESRQASPSPEAKAERSPLPPTRVRTSSSSVSSVNPIEKKAPLEQTETGFGSAASRAATTPANTTPPRSMSFGSQHSAWTQGTSPAVPKTPAWGSAAQSPAGKAKSIFSSITSSVSSFAFGSHSEPTTPSISQERGPPAHAVSPSNRQVPGAGQGPWGQKRSWSTVAPSPSSQQSSKLSLPPPPAVELSNNASSAPAPSSIPVRPASAPETLPPAESTIQRADREGKEVTEALSDSVIVDSGMPSAENGEPARNEKASQDPVVQPSVTTGGSSEADRPSGRDDANGAEDGDLVNITPHDVAEASKEAGSEPRPQGGPTGRDDDDDDEDTPLDLRLARVRQTTADSVSSAATTDTETQGEDERPSPPKGPKLRTTNLSHGTEGIDSPVIGDSPVVGVSSICLPPCGFRALYSHRAVLQSPSTTLSAAERKRQRKARQKANKLAKGLS